MVDAHALGACGLGRAGSNPASPTRGLYARRVQLTRTIARGTTLLTNVAQESRYELEGAYNMKIPQDNPWCSTGRTLGEGGQGRVEVVTQKEQSNGQKYALKILNNVDSLQARHRFRREIEVIEKLESPRIVRVIDSSQAEDDFQFYVMEYHEGAKTLDSIITSDSNPYHGDVIKCLYLFEQIIFAIRDCLDADSSMVHRDIKPKNILVLPDTTIRLIDFGICQVQDGAMITLVDENVGARGYTSPECESGNDGSVSYRSDIYSAAKVLWSAMTSKQAFPREVAVFNERSMRHMFHNKPETWHLAHIFEKTIREDPNNRIEGINQLVALIREVRYLIERGFPPLEDAVYRCPSCGSNNIMGYPDWRTVFANPMPSGLKAVICNTCGFVFVRDVELWKFNVDRLKKLS